MSVLKLGSQVVTVVLVGAFAIWGVTGLGSAPSSDTIAEIGDSKITVSEYKQSLNEYARKSFTMAKYLDVQPQERLKIARTVFQYMLRDKIVDDFASKNGLMMPDKVVIEQIKSEKSFKGKKGNFDEALFEKTLQLSNLSREDYIRRRKQEYMNNMVNSAISLSPSTAISPEVAVPYYRYENEMRKTRYLTLLASDINVSLPKDPAVLLNFYDTHSHLFSSQELRSFQYITLNKQNVVESWSQVMEVSDEESQKIYDENKDFYKTPESVDLRQVIFESKAEAEEFYNQVSGNEKDFDKIGRSFKKSGVSQLDKVESEHLFDELSEYAFNAEIGEVSQPIKTTLGWHVVRLIAYYPELVPAMENIIEDIKVNYTFDKAEAKFERLVSDTRNQVGALTLDELSDIFGTGRVSVKLVDSEGYPEGDVKKERVEVPNNLLAHVFDHDQDDGVGLIQPVKGTYIAYQIEDVVDSNFRPYDEREVFLLWSDQERLRLNIERGNAIEEAVNLGDTTLEDIAENLNLPLKETDFMTQVTDVGLLGELSPYVRDKIFRVPESLSVSGPGSSSGVWVVAQYSGSEELEIDEDAIDNIAQKIAMDLNNSLDHYYLISVITQTDVRINNAMYEQVMESAAFTPTE